MTTTRLRFHSRTALGASLGASLSVALGVVLALLPATARGQSLYDVDGTSVLVNEFTGPPAPPCLYPHGPMISGFPYGVLGPCTAPTPFPPPPGFPFGDVATDRIKDQVYMTDGKHIGVFTMTGTQINVMPIGPLGIAAPAGMGYDSTGGFLWITDGALIYKTTPSAPGSCLPPTIMSAFPPVGLGFTTDVSWYPGGSLLYACDTAGNIAAYTAAGVLSLGPYPAFGVSSACLGPALQGIAVDTSTGCPGVPKLYVSDGFTVSREMSGGFPAPPTFYTPFPCFPIPGLPTQGIDYAARAIQYGTGTGPIIGAKGQSVLPNPTFAITLSGGPPLGKAWLVVGTGAACPSLTFFGNPWYVAPFSTIIGPFILPASGSITLPAALPSPGGPLPCGTSIYMQWVCRSTTLVWTTSAGMEFTASLP